MSDKVIPFFRFTEVVKAPGEFKFQASRWRCSIHGDHDNCIHIATVNGERRTYCVPCIVDLLDRVGLKNLPHV